ncbi:hypothetical protein GALMADRAFT_397652 [Galerina marginata CBS 339.88]|uniref:Uncharacterized protein n=1 Tax=Galerina marginata (strain CBS 339.88) TaxID=685588 RepID=A0A067U153_GALM3|nr:hypothetical protein GALMADRAFT_397652 [Galerina marginata CBS 339.88]
MYRAYHLLRRGSFTRQFMTKSPPVFVTPRLRPLQRRGFFSPPPPQSAKSQIVLYAIAKILFCYGGLLFGSIAIGKYGSVALFNLGYQDDLKSDIKHFLIFSQIIDEEFLSVDLSDPVATLQHLQKQFCAFPLHPHDRYFQFTLGDGDSALVSVLMNSRGKEMAHTILQKLARDVHEALANVKHTKYRPNEHAFYRIQKAYRESVESLEALCKKVSAANVAHSVRNFLRCVLQVIQQILLKAHPRVDIFKISLLSVTNYAKLRNDVSSYVIYMNECGLLS